MARDTEILTAYGSRVNLAEQELLSLLGRFGIDPQQVSFKYDAGESDRYQACFPFPQE